MSIYTVSRREIFERKSRSMLTILGIAVGVATIVALLSIGFGMQEQIRKSLDKILGAGFIVINENQLIFSTGGQLDASLAREIKRIKGVDAAVPILSEHVYIPKYSILPISVMGVDPQEADKISNVELASGRDWLPKDEGKLSAVVGYSIADALDLKPGDTLKVRLDVEGEKYVTLRVIAVAKPTGFGDQDQTIYLPYSTVEKLYGEYGKATMILVKLEDERYADSVKTQIEKRFKGLRVVEKKFLMEGVSQIMGTINSVLLGLGAISLLVGGLGVMNTIMTSVLERTRQIGILKAIGASRKKILVMFLFESVLLGIIGGAIGCVGGVVMTKLASLFIFKWTGIFLPFKLYSWVFLFASGVSILVGIGAGLYPSYRASNLRPVEALRYE